MKKDVLNRPFPDEMIKDRPGPGGMKLSYVEGHEYIKRLNEAFESNWSFEIKEHHIVEKHIIVIATIKAEGISKTAFGSSEIKSGRNGDPISIGDDMKSAATDALKKASSLFGLGLHLYGDKPSTQKTKTYGTPVVKHIGKNGIPYATDKQKNMIKALAAKRGISLEELNTKIAETYNCEINQLSVGKASNIIERLQKKE